MTSEVWPILIVISKFLVSLGVAGCVGACCTLLIFTNKNVLTSQYQQIHKWQNKISKYAIISIGVGFFANAADFFIQTGNFSETGLSGMIEPDMLQMMWGSAYGTLTLLRACIFAISGALFCYIIKYSVPFKSIASLTIYSVFTSFIIFSLSYSYSILGHTNSIALGSFILITLHVAAAFIWLGSLAPLIFATTIFDKTELYYLMNKFGNIAIYFVLFLLIAGIGILLQLLGSLEELYTTPYGQFFVVKIILVIVMLIFALWHKLLLVPKLLNQTQGHLKLKHSIIVELAIGMLILFITSIITTAVGPIT